MKELKNSALLLIEFQNEWLDSSGKLHHLMEDKVQFEQSISQASNVLKAARKWNMPIIHSGLFFSDIYHELGGAKAGLRAHIPLHKTFMKTHTGSEFAAPFIPLENEFVASGRVGASAFAGSNLDVYLRNNNINNLFLMGYALHVCVESTLRHAHDLGYNCIVLEDATAAFNAQQKQYVVDNIIQHFGKCMTSNQFLTWGDT